MPLEGLADETPAVQTFLGDFALAELQQGQFIHRIRRLELDLTPASTEEKVTHLLAAAYPANCLFNAEMDACRKVKSHLWMWRNENGPNMGVHLPGGPSAGMLYFPRRE